MDSRFGDAVQREFAFLISEYGFEISDATSDVVTFESPHVEVTASYYPSEYQVDIVARLAGTDDPERECERRGWELLRIEQDVLSAKTVKRPGLQAALEACREGAADGIVVAKLDRLSRSIVDFARLLEEGRRRGFNVVALDLGLDLSTPQGELVANVIASVAQWEIRIIGQRTKDALAAKKAQGVRLGRPRVVPQEVVTRIKRQRARGKTYAAIAETLNRDNVPTAHGGARWYPATVRALLVGS